MKSISELAIGKQWDIVNQGSLHQSFNKSCPTYGRDTAFGYQDISDSYFPADLKTNNNTHNTIESYVNRFE